MNNKIALNLTLYFSAVLLVFALIIGGVFYQFFKQQTIEIKEKEMRLRAEKIAEVLSDNMERMESRHGDGIANSKFISYLDNVTQEIVWVVDSNRQLSINKDSVQRQRREVQKHHEHSGFGLFKRPLPPIAWKEPPKTSKEAYERLPAQVREKVEEGFSGKEFIIEEYNPVLDGIMLTVGRPIYDSKGQVKAVLLLHSPVAGLQDAIWSGLRILLISLLVAMALGMLLSVVLSWRFTGTIEKMKKVIWIVVVVLVVLFISGSCSAYNRMVTAEETVNTTWADVEAQYQRRSDLIPNLVNTVKGYAAHEQSTFTEVVEARAQAMSFKLDAADLTPEKLAEFQQAQQKVGSALGRLIAVAEQYPDLKANQNFLELQAQLEGTENRINVARKNFNDAAQAYNTNIRRFPKNIFAGMFGFDKKAYFEAEEGSEKAPKVEF